MNNRNARRKVNFSLLFLFAFLLISAGLIASGSIKSFAKLNEDPGNQPPAKQADENFARQKNTRWITVAEAEAEHIQNVVREKGENFDLRAVEKHGELTVIEADEEQILDLTRKMHEEFHKCAGFMSHETLEAARLSIEETERAESAQAIAAYTIDNQTNVNAMLAEAKEAEILETITRLSTDFPNRRYNQPSGVASANWIKDKWTALAAARPDITVEFFNHPSTTSPQPSIILTVPGTTLPGEVVVLGGHQDSINHAGGGATGGAPGADDDASGIGSLTEAIRVLVAKNFRPQRTVKFMAYAAEEIGLVGSSAIAADFQARGVNVVGVLQLDMTNYKSSDSAFDIAVISDYTNAAQNQFLRDLITTYQPSLTFANATCGYSCSDHASWTNRGFPASFPFEPRSNPTIHTTSDTLAQSGNSASHAVKYTKIALSYVGELAKGTFASTYTISGTVLNNDTALSGASISLSGSATNAVITNSSGGYSFTVNPNGNYTVTAAKSGDVKGINSLDAARIQQHLVGLTDLSAAQLVAADTDGNGAVNSLDATRIQQYQVNIPAQNIIGQWKFLPDNRQYNSINSSLSSENYAAILVGEVSGDWSSASRFAGNEETKETKTAQRSKNDQNNSQNTTAHSANSGRFERELGLRISERMKQSISVEAGETVETGETTDSLSAKSIAGAGVSVSLPQNATAAAGSTVTIPVSIGA
ncbi:MAG TPA: M20/M25/M40 family metallo-hydrolase, partial [Pyrinomonadaceae bacterium]